MSGLDKNTTIVYKTPTVYVKDTIGNFVDTLFTANSANVVSETTGIDYVDVSSSNFTILAIDQTGNSSLVPLLRVKRITRASLLTAPQILKVFDQQGNTLVCGAESPICTRINNIVDAQPLDQFNIGDGFCCGLTTYAPTVSGIQVVQLSPNTSWQVPNVVTATWGEFSCTRDDAYNFIQVCQDYPDSVDPNDVNVFGEILGEMTIYAPINTITDITSTYAGGAYLYWIETNTSADWSSFQLYPTSLQVGYPQPGVVGAAKKLSVSEASAPSAPVVGSKASQKEKMSAKEILKEIKITKTVKAL